MDLIDHDPPSASSSSRSTYSLLPFASPYPKLIQSEVPNTHADVLAPMSMGLTLTYRKLLDVVNNKLSTGGLDHPSPV